MLAEPTKIIQSEIYVLKTILFRYERVDVRSVGTQTAMELPFAMGTERLKSVTIIYDYTFVTVKFWYIYIYLRWWVPPFLS